MKVVEDPRDYRKAGYVAICIIKQYFIRFSNVAQGTKTISIKKLREPVK